MEQFGNTYGVLGGKREKTRPSGRLRRRPEDNIKMDLREVGCDPRDWIALAEDRNQWRAYVRAVMNLRVLLKAVFPLLVRKVVVTLKKYFQLLSF